jgi:hypothetical protein
MVRASCCAFYCLVVWWADPALFMQPTSPFRSLTHCWWASERLEHWPVNPDPRACVTVHNHGWELQPIWFTYTGSGQHLCILLDRAWSPGFGHNMSPFLWDLEGQCYYSSLAGVVVVCPKRGRSPLTIYATLQFSQHGFWALPDHSLCL